MWVVLCAVRCSGLLIQLLGTAAAGVTVTGSFCIAVPAVGVAAASIWRLLVALVVGTVVVGVVVVIDGGGGGGGRGFSAAATAIDDDGAAVAAVVVLCILWMLELAARQVVWFGMMCAGGL